jgi:uncharacterized protein YcbK (DUF882 family)
MELFGSFEQIRTAIGKPLTINSGYRCPAYNARIGGAQMSAHTFGLALDISFDTKTHRTTTEEVKSLVEAVNSLVPNLRMGTYPTFIHIDTAYLIVPRMSAAWQHGVRFIGASE